MLIKFQNSKINQFAKTLKEIYFLRNFKTYMYKEKMDN